MNLLKSRYTKQLSEIINQVKKNAENHFVQQFLDIPPISQLRLQLLYLFLNDQKLPENIIKQYCVSTTLIQMGLDSHEDVPLHNEGEPDDERYRQLLVLSGDYYSSRYYYILAQIKDMDTIKMLATSIQTINEAKVNLYYKSKKNKMGIQHYLNCINLIDTNLYTSYATRYPFQGQAWTRLIRNLVLADRLLNEYRLFQWDNKVQGYLSLLARGKDLYGSVNKLTEKVQELLQSAKETALRLKREETRNEVLLLISEYGKQVDLAPNRIVEEM